MAEMLNDAELFFAPSKYPLVKYVVDVNAFVQNSSNEKPRFFECRHVILEIQLWLSGTHKPNIMQKSAQSVLDFLHWNIRDVRNVYLTTRPSIKDDVD